MSAFDPHDHPILLPDQDVAGEPDTIGSDLAVVRRVRLMANQQVPVHLNHFGGSAHAEFGSLLYVVEPVAGFTTRNRIQDFNSGDRSNPCPVGFLGH